MPSSIFFVRERDVQRFARVTQHLANLGDDSEDLFGPYCAEMPEGDAAVVIFPE